METVIIVALGYLAIGAALFCHPPAPARPDDFDWRNQQRVFRDSLPIVLTWPMVLLRFAGRR